MSTPKNNHAVMLGRRGGKASAAKLTAEQRAEKARRAVAARIAKYGQRRQHDENKELTT